MVAVRFGSYNLFNLFASDDPAERQRYEEIVEVIRLLDTDVLAIQELTGGSPAIAGARLQAVAHATGMECTVEAGRPVIAVGQQGFHTGLLWRPGLHVLPGSFDAFGPTDFWHGLAKVTFDFDGRRVQHASHHATPFSRRMRAEQMDRVVSLLTRPADRPPGLIGADWNTVGADRRPDGSYYDHDPYLGDWTPDLIYQAVWSYDEQGRRHHRADRVPGDVLYAGGLRDAAAALGTTWAPTTGHLAGDPYPQRRIDAIRVTEEVVPALQKYETLHTDLACRASDHLPVVVTYDTDLIAELEGSRPTPTTREEQRPARNMRRWSR